MNGNNLLVDTNIAIYLLLGNETIINLLHEKHIYISFITQLELLGHKNLSAEEQQQVAQFISDCIVVDINEEIKKNVVAIRKAHTVKLPDAIIAGTATYLHMPLITGDKGFEKIENLSIIFFEQ